MVLTIKNFSNPVWPWITATAPTNLVWVAGTLKATLTWTSATGESWVVWTEEKLVRKEWSAPQWSMDWDVVTTITTKDTYASTWYDDEWLDDTKTYYYKVFAIYDNGTEMWSTDITVTPLAPIEAWIYHSATLWLITIADGNGNDITIADKNLWATQVYNDGDTLSEANCWKYYQRWNNYGFPRTWTVTTSSTKVDASTYWPWNYYSSSTFITTFSSPYDWSSVQNDNLWWWTTGTNEAMQGPCATGFHVPTKDENVALVAAMTALWIDTSNGNCMKTYMKMPFAGNRDEAFATVANQGTDSNYWSSTASSATGAYFLSSSLSMLNANGGTHRSSGFSIRPFKNEVVAPDNTWTKIYEKTTPLCFTAQQANSTVTLNKMWTPTAVNLEISTDWTTWTDYTIGAIPLANVGDKVYMRNKSETDTRFSTSSSNKYYFSMTWSISASGDITSLLNKNYTTIVTGYSFFWLFEWCISLTTAPKLPGKFVATECYMTMFQGCTSLTTLPELPATTLTPRCYHSMFGWCTSIKLSTTQSWSYQTPYRIPTTWTWTTGTNSLQDMFYNTGGAFTWTPSINTTYYTSNTVI